MYDNDPVCISIGQGGINAGINLLNHLSDSKSKPCLTWAGAMGPEKIDSCHLGHFVFRTLYHLLIIQIIQIPSQKKTEICLHSKVCHQLSFDGNKQILFQKSLDKLALRGLSPTNFVPKLEFFFFFDNFLKITPRILKMFCWYLI